jgi:hypothetical protein
MELISLGKAALQLRCHPETLRRRIREGRLKVEGRGAHGEYLISARSLARVRLEVGGRPRARWRRSEARVDIWDLYRPWMHRLGPATREYLWKALNDRGFDLELTVFLDFRRLRAAEVSVRSAARRLHLKMALADRWDGWGVKEIERMLVGRIRRQYGA